MVYNNFPILYKNSYRVFGNEMRPIAGQEIWNVVFRLRIQVFLGLNVSLDTAVRILCECMHLAPKEGLPVLWNKTHHLITINRH